MDDGWRITVTKFSIYTVSRNRRSIHPLGATAGIRLDVRLLVRHSFLYSFVLVRRFQTTTPSDRRTTINGPQYDDGITPIN